MRIFVGTLAVASLLAACGGNDAPEIEPAPPDPTPPLAEASLPPPPPEVTDEELLPPPPPPVAENLLTNRTLDDINLDSPLEPVFFRLDSAELDAGGRAVASANADVLRANPSWVITVEGHCDERGTAEYNLALGERRAEAVKAYLVSLGIDAGRIQTVSYGKEFPFETGQNEAAWAANRRGHFVVTAQ